MTNIKAGSNGINVEFHVLADGVAVPIIGAEVIVEFKTGKRIFSKTAQITDGAKGIASTVFTKDDLATPGMYYGKATVNMQNGNIFPSDEFSFKVD